jgi:hypothetical protein
MIQVQLVGIINLSYYQPIWRSFPVLSTSLNPSMLHSLQPTDGCHSIGDTVTLQTSHDLKYLKQTCCVEVAKPTTRNSDADSTTGTGTGIGIDKVNGLPSFDDITSAAKTGMDALLKGNTRSTGIPTMTDGSGS